MAGVTDTGWETKTYSTILGELSDGAKERWGEDFPTTPESNFGGLASIIAYALKDVWDLGQQVTDTHNRDTATGLYLDYLAGSVGLTRQAASGATGNIIFTGDVGTTVVSATSCKDTLSNVILTTESVTLNRANCYTSTFSVISVQDSTDYTLIVEGLEVTVNSGIGNDKAYILTGLKNALDLSGSTVNIVDEDELTLNVTLSSNSNTLTTTNSSNLKLESVGSLVASESAETGDISIEENTVTRLVTSNIGISSINNPAAFTDGRSLETDSELRLRMEELEQDTGTATVPSITSSLYEVSGVTSVVLVVNNTLTDNVVTGVPAKKYEAFVIGGDDNDIAEVLWRTNPIMGNTHGTTTMTIIDSNGDTQGVSFSRPTTEFAWFRISYTIDEEDSDFPANGEDQMAEAIVTYGEAVAQGTDFEPTKYYGPLYTVSGVQITGIEIATTVDELGTPTYQTTKIEVDTTDILDYSTDRVIFST